MAENKQWEISQIKLWNMHKDLSFEVSWLADYGVYNENNKFKLTDSKYWVIFPKKSQKYQEGLVEEFFRVTYRIEIRNTYKLK